MQSMRSFFLALALWFGLAVGPAQAQQIGPVTAPLQVAVDPPAVPEGWDTVSGTWLEVHGRPEEGALLLDLARQGSAAVDRLAQTLGVPVGGTIHVYLTPTQHAFETLQPGRPPVYADATAWPTHGAIFLRRPRIRAPEANPLQQVLEHELIHVLLGRAFAPAQPPHWLQEGAAQFYSGEYDPTTAQRLARGWAGQGELIGLAELSRGFPSDPARADLAYAQSADFVAFLLATYGEAAFPALLDAVREGLPLERAVRVATGEELADVDEAWRSRLRSGVPLWISGLGSEEFWWAAIGVVAAGALVSARGRRRAELEAYAEEERRRDALIAAMMQRHLREMGWTPPVASRQG